MCSYFLFGTQTLCEDIRPEIVNEVVNNLYDFLNFLFILQHIKIFNTLKKLRNTRMRKNSEGSLGQLP